MRWISKSSLPHGRNGVMERGQMIHRVLRTSDDELSLREICQIKKKQTEFLSCQLKNIPDWIDRIDSDPNGFKGFSHIIGFNK